MDQDKRMEPNEPITDKETAQVEGGATEGDLFYMGLKCKQCSYVAVYSLKLAWKPCPNCGGTLTIVDLADLSIRR